MLWFVLFLLLLFSIPAYFISQRNRDSLMDAMAMHERLQRTDPEDPLAQLGPTEYQRAYERAQKNRARGLTKGMGLGLLAGFFIGPVVGFAGSFMLDDADLFMPLLALAFFGFMFYGMWRGASKQPNVYDQMRKDLHLS